MYVLTCVYVLGLTTCRFTMSEMSSRLFLISPQRMDLFSWLIVSSSLCLTITSSFWALS